jgi:hypothetical protein
VGPGGMPLICPDISSDMRLGAGSEEPHGLGRVRALGCGLERPTWQVRGERRCNYSRVSLPALVGTELPAAGGGLFTRGFHGAVSVARTHRRALGA